MGSRHFWVDGTEAFLAACNAAQVDQELAEQRHARNAAIDAVADMAGGDCYAVAEIENARDAAMEWFNATKKSAVLAWFELYYAAIHRDPADILSPMDGKLRSGWEETVIEARAAAILEGIAL